MNTRITGISSMATKALLADLVEPYTRRTGVEVIIESVGGVAAAKRVQMREHFDLAFLAADVIDSLIHAGGLQAGSRVDLVRSPMAVAVRTGQRQPDVSTDEALRQAVLAAPSICYSTGPSGAQFLKMLERWGIAPQVASRLVQTPAGVPVAAVLARGDAELGFQQLGELINVPGCEVLGELPGKAAFVTIFSAGMGLNLEPTQTQAVRNLLDFFNSPDALPAKRKNGMDAA